MPAIEIDGVARAEERQPPELGATDQNPQQNPQRV